MQMQLPSARKEASEYGYYGIGIRSILRIWKGKTYAGFSTAIKKDNPLRKSPCSRKIQAAKAAAIAFVLQSAQKKPVESYYVSNFYRSGGKSLEKDCNMRYNVIVNNADFRQEEIRSGDR